MQTIFATPTERPAESGDALQFFDHGRERDTAPDLRARLRSFYRHQPLRALERGQ